MKRVLAMTALGFAVVLSLTLTLGAGARAATVPSQISRAHASIVLPASLSVVDKVCPRYKYPHHSCPILPSQVTIVCAGVTLTGTHTPGTAITCVGVGLLMTLCPGETGTSISIHGTNLDLTVAGARIFKFDPATGQSTEVGAITGSGGEYTIVFGSCAGPGAGPGTVVQFPVTGGSSTAAPIYPGRPISPGGPSSPGIPYLPVGIAMAAALIGGALKLRSRAA